MIDPESTTLDDTVVIGDSSVIYPGNVLEGETSIGKRCVLYPGSYIRDCSIGDGAQVYSSCLMHATVPAGAVIGPYAKYNKNY